ncbi:MAG: PAS domain-containing protein [Opitutaceae bacterium]
MIETKRTTNWVGNRSTFTVDPEFRDHLLGYRLGRLGESLDSVYVLDRDFRIRGMNAAYRKAALRAGGRKWLRRYGLGFPVLEAFMGFYAEHYRRIYHRCLEDGRPYGALYGGEAGRVYRWYRETIQPLHDRSGLLVTHHLLQTIRRSEASRFQPEVHRSSDGLVLQCCHCQRVRNCLKSGLWEWLPDLALACPDSDISHGLCPRCVDAYYRDFLPKREAAIEG